MRNTFAYADSYGSRYSDTDRNPEPHAHLHSCVAERAVDAERQGVRIRCNG